MSQATYVWLKGLLSALFGGIAGAIGPLLADPHDFAPTADNLARLAIVSGVSAVVTVVAYLARSPLPEAFGDDGTK